MKNMLLLGGNGYIGQAFVREVLKKDKEVQLYIVSRSGSSLIKDERINNISADFSENEPVLGNIPDRIDCVVNFIGGPNKDMIELKKNNQIPVENMIKIAEKYHAHLLGFIGGALGPKSFTSIKVDLIQKLKDTGKKVFYIEPTIVYGGGRKDSLAKIIPMLKFLGIFIKGFRPIHVDKVVSDLIIKIYEN